MQTFLQTHVFNCFGLYIRPRTYLQKIESGGYPNPILVIFVFFINYLFLGLESIHDLAGPLLLFSAIFAIAEYFVFYWLINWLAVFLGGESNHKGLIRMAYCAQMPFALAVIVAIPFMVWIPDAIALLLFLGLLVNVWKFCIFIYGLSFLYKFSAGRSIFLIIFFQFSLVVLVVLLVLPFVILSIFL